MSGVNHNAIDFIVADEPLRRVAPTTRL
jgi:hypothetical protein